ncbi:type VI lipase adapter Tla3 domain-containing protein [Janthinobacterium sp. RB2R34]|uniref:type VI lipase adapter Tla3 domain-containing protein n=1 Tax=Janthinobacterium sp. RB2R34 TaxID=3424193 RepID=UPI003F1E6FD8
MMVRLFWVLSVLLVLIAGLLWIGAAAKNDTRRQISQKLSTEANPTSGEHAQHEYVLEVIGLGVTLDKYRQGKLWDALQKGNPFTTIREQDAKKYPWTASDKDGTGGTRAYDALENGINFTPICWGMPSFYAGTPILDPSKQPSPADPMAGLVAGAATGGMPMHLFSIASWKLDEHPDDLLNEVFAFFDANPDVPFVALHSEDSVGTRDGSRKPGESRKLHDGYYVPEMPDATAVFILARRERVASMQPYIWDDPENKFVNGQFRAMYFELMNSLATPPDNISSYVPQTRQPTVPEWLAATAKFAQRPDVRGQGVYQFNAINPWINRPPQTWKPTPWFPIPWNREQMATFDRLPSYGFVHRPVFIKLTDENGKPVTRRDERQKIFNAGWQEALQTLPQAERSKGAARIVAATGKQPAQQLMLEGMLHDYAAHGGPEIDSSKTSQFINTDQRLGNTGAATFFVQMAIGVMGSYLEGGASAAINLRDRNRASIIFITPPSSAVREEQAGREIFRSRVTPAVDPANYGAPSVESLLERPATK